MSENMTSLNVDSAVSILTKAYSTVINNEQRLSVLPSVMLWGAPGVGKSQGVRQLAKAIEIETKKQVCVTDVRLLLFNPIDLRGIPTSNAEKTLAIWLKPKIFQMDDSQDVVNILFLDEISAAPQSVQAAAYQITLDRTVGEHKLPENCIVIAAGNRVTDKSVAFKMPKALANRLCHFEIESHFKSWKNWAVRSGINPKVVGFLTFRQNALDGFGTDDMLAFPTPRSWEMTSNILNFVSDDISAVYPMIAGCIGLGMAVEFRTWAKVFDSLPSTEGIFEGTENTVPLDSSAMYAVVASMTAYAKKHMHNMTQISNSIKYAMKIPPDFSMMLIRDYMIFSSEFKSKLIQLPELSDWLKKNGKYLL